MQEVEPAITQEVFEVLDIDAAVNARRSFGGTAPSRVREAVGAARRRYLDQGGT
jgi:argininosuccinate lyase